VPLYELPLWPHAQYYFRDRHPMRVNDGLAAYFDRPDVPLFIYADGVSHARDARVFQWQPSDAYSKLTRNHYRVVTLDPILPEERYLPLRGVYPLERTIAGDEWRWLTGDSLIRLPSAHRSSVTLTFRLSPDAPYDANSIHLAVNGRPAGEVIARREASSIKLSLPAGPVEIAIHADQAFAPATVLHNQDPRILAVQLIGVVQSP